MNSALLIEVLVLVLGLYFIEREKQDKARKYYITVIISLLILESGLRSISVGFDTGNYYIWFEKCKSLSWNDVLQNTSEDRDPGFSVMMKLCQIVSGDFNFFLTLAALLFFSPLGIILYRYSSHISQLIFAFTLYLSLFHIIALSGLRQQIAMGASFWAFLLYGKNRYVYGSLLLLLGSTIHVSLLLFFAVPIMHYFVKRRSYKTIHLMTLLSIPFVLVSAKLFVGYMASFLSDDYYSDYAEKEGSGAFVYVVLMELLSFFCFIIIKKDYIIRYGELAYLYVNLPFLTFFVPMITLDGTLIRMGQYFTMYMMLLFPYAIDIFTKKKDRVIFYSLSVIILILSMLQNSMEYHFFWENAPVY
jgi:transmembrane protein EpsG